MNPPFTFTRAQLVEMARPPRDKQRDQMLLEMAAFWMLYEKDWADHFVCTLSYEERKDFFGEVYDWGLYIGLSERAHFLTIAVLLLRAVYYGWPPEDIDLARHFIEADVDDDPVPAIEWLEYAFEQ